MLDFDQQSNQQLLSPFTSENEYTHDILNFNLKTSTTIMVQEVTVKFSWWINLRKIIFLTLLIQQT